MCINADNLTFVKIIMSTEVENGSVAAIDKIPNVESRKQHKRNIGCKIMKMSAVFYQYISMQLG